MEPWNCSMLKPWHCGILGPLDHSARSPQTQGMWPLVNRSSEPWDGGSHRILGGLRHSTQKSHIGGAIRWSLRTETVRNTASAPPSPVGWPGRLSEATEAWRHSLSPSLGQPQERRTTPSSRPGASQPPNTQRVPCFQGQVRLSRCRETVPASGQARRDAECSAASGKRINGFLLHPHPLKSQQQHDSGGRLYPGCIVSGWRRQEAAPQHWFCPRQESQPSSDCTRHIRALMNSPGTVHPADLTPDAQHNQSVLERGN